MSFQDNLKYYREKAGYTTAKEFSEALGLSYTTYFAYENQGREPKYKLLCKISDLLDVSTDELLGHTAKQKTDDDILEKRIKDILATSDDASFKLAGINEAYVMFEIVTNDNGIFKFEKNSIKNFIRKIDRDFEEQANKNLCNVFNLIAVSLAVERLQNRLETLKNIELKDQINRIELINKTVTKIQEMQFLQGKLATKDTMKYFRKLKDVLAESEMR